MKFGRLVKHWLPPLLLAVIALVAWRAANNADFDPISAQAEQYDLSLETPLLSARRTPQTLRAPLSDAAVAPLIDQVVQQSPNQLYCVAVRNEDRILGTPQEVSGGLIPASNQKVITTYAALGILSPDFEFNTRVTATSAPVDGVVEGDLYLVGDGDPFLITDNWLAQFEQVNGRSHTRLEDLADAVAAAGVTTVTGSLFGDESLYDDVRYGAWDSRLIEQQQSGPISALTVNEGFSDWPADVTATLRDRTVADDPPLNAASVFGQLLAERGITFGGAPSVGVSPPSAADIASVQSPPLLDIVTHINSYSSNIGAELLIKRLGLIVGGVGSTAAGSQAVTDYLVDQGIPMNDVIILDGSGLDEDNRLTCTALVTILTETGPDSPLGLSLSVAGERGSLAERFVDTAAEGRVMAKTGTLCCVRALAGYVESAVASDPDSYVSFAYIVNAPSLLPDEAVLPLQDALASALTTYPAGPSVADLSPLAPVPAQ